MEKIEIYDEDIELLYKLYKKKIIQRLENSDPLIDGEFMVINDAVRCLERLRRSIEKK